MARLTPTERETLRGAASRALRFVTGKPMLPEHEKELFSVMSALKDNTQANIGKEAIALWAAKIDFAIANNDKKNVSALISAKDAARIIERGGKIGTVAFWDSNGGCSCGGGGGGPAGW